MTVFDFQDDVAYNLAHTTHSRPWALHSIVSASNTVLQQHKHNRHRNIQLHGTIEAPSTAKPSKVEPPQQLQALNVLPTAISSRVPTTQPACRIKRRLVDFIFRLLFDLSARWRHPTNRFTLFPTTQPPPLFFYPFISETHSLPINLLSILSIPIGICGFFCRPLLLRFSKNREISIKNFT